MHLSYKNALIKSYCSFVNNLIVAFFPIGCAPKDSQNFMQSLLLYTSCLFSMLLIDDTVDIEKLDGIYLLTFVIDEFWGLFLHPSIFSIIHSRSA